MVLNFDLNFVLNFDQAALLLPLHNIPDEVATMGIPNDIVLAQEALALATSNNLDEAKHNVEDDNAFIDSFDGRNHSHNDLMKQRTGCDNIAITSIIAIAQHTNQNTTVKVVKEL